MKLVWTKDPKKDGLKHARFNWGQIESAVYQGTSLSAARITRNVGSKDLIVFIYDWSKSPINPTQTRMIYKFATVTAAKKAVADYIAANVSIQPSCVRFK